LSFRPPRAEPLLIDGPAGVLEALLEDPRAAPPSSPPGSSSQSPPPALPVTGFAVVCHPHPLHGGTMHNKVVHTVARACQERAMPTLRFNYRGVGASAGSYDQGRGETQDTLAVVAAGRARWPGAALTLAGFSFGGMVSLLAAAVAAPARLISVAPAVTGAEFDSIARPAAAWLIVQGEADEIIRCAEVQAFAARFQPPPHLVVLPRAGHFFHGCLPELRDAAFEFLGSD
jgi:alpha/beta superfamily hydrolase